MKLLENHWKANKHILHESKQIIWGKLALKVLKEKNPDLLGQKPNKFTGSTFKELNSLERMRI